ncbi:hypothetical protein BH11MYX3_BH11MYX3_43860 [soil metagenome]
MRSSCLVLLVVFAACSDDRGGVSPPDASIDAVAAPLDAPTNRATNLVAIFGGDTRKLDRAYYGITKSATESTLHVEAYTGGGAGCPTMSSPTTDYTLILGKVPTAAATTSPGNLLDFKGDLLDGPLGAAATKVTLSAFGADVCPSCVGMPAPADADGFAAFHASLTFAAGTIEGYVFATHCDSLDESL